MRVSHSARGWIEATLVAAACAIAAPVAAQERATVAVDDSPTATQLLAQASDQAAANPAESARLVRQVLAEFGRKLVPLPDDPDRFVDARSVADAMLRANPEVLRRWRALESAEALRQFEDGDVEGAAAQRPLAMGGLQAQLALADEELVHARFRKALSRISAARGHPDLNGDLLHRALRIEALAAWGIGERQRAESAAAQLESAFPAGGSALRTLIAAAPPATPVEVNDPLSPQPFGNVGGAPIRLWQEALDQSLKRRMQPGADERQRAPSLPAADRQAGRFLVSVPALARGLVIVNEGHRLQALGAFTREPVWSVLMTSPGAPREGQVGDLSVPIVCGDRVLAVSGHSSGADRDGGIDREGGGRLLCLDIGSGRRLWEFQPRWHARAGLEGTFIVGAPAVLEDTVALLLRRMSARQETISIAAGISLADGSLRWTVPLGATPGIRVTSSAIRPCATPVASGDSFVVHTGAGVTARLSCVDGRVMWLRRDQVPIRDARFDLEPWQMQRPAVCGDRIMLIDAEQQHVQVIGTSDGRQLSLAPIGTGTAWRDTRWLLASADGAHVLGVGEQLVCFAADDIRTPRWRSGSGPEPRLTTGSETVIGRVQVGTLPDGRGAVAIPTAAGISVRAIDDGTELAALDVGAPSNPSLRDGMGSIATEDAIAMYVDSRQTEEFLSAAAQRGDPTAVAGLLELAVASSRADLASSASAMASAWLSRDRTPAEKGSDELADRIAALLIDVACSGLLDARESSELFDRVIARESDPSRRAQALLVQGDWFARADRLPAAIAVWRRVLSDRALAGSWLEPAGEQANILRAGIAARDRLAALLVSRAAPAVRAVDAAPPAPGAPGSALADYARAVACSRESVDAWIAAAESWSAAGDRVRAAAASSAALDEAIALADTAVVASALDRALSVLRKEALPDSAVRLVDRAVTAGMDVPLPSFKGQTASQVRGALPSASLVRGEPRAGSPRASRAVRTLRGEPTIMTPRARVTRPTDRFWLTERGSLACISADSLTPLWRVPFAGQSPAIVQHSAGGIVLWEMLDADRSSLGLVDDAGARRWTVPDVDALLDGDAPDQAVRPEPVPRFGRESSIRLPGVFPGPADVALLRGDGAVAVVDATEGSLTWRSKGAVDEIIDADADDAVIVIAGVSAAGDGLARAIAIDRATGTPVAVLSDPDIGSVRWVRIMAPGQVAVGHDAGTSRWDLLDDRVSWIREDLSAQRSDGVDGVGRTLLLYCDGRTPQAIRWSDGSIEANAFELLTSRRHRPAEWQGFMRSGDVIVAGDERGVGLFGLDGSLLGATVSVPGQFLHSVVPVGAGLVVTEQAGRVDAPVGVGSRVRSRLRLQLLGWSDGLKMRGLPESFDVPAQAFGTPIAVEGWIVIPAGKDSSYAVPIPAG
jgi:outer membrane protein assembly factor BamB